MIEEVVYGDDGQLMTGSFMDYGLPRASTSRVSRLDATVTPTPVNRSARGRGRSGHARFDIVHRLGGSGRVERVRRQTRGHDLRPEKLWRIIQKGQP
jgi:carbon-monoxide dehydrogenase large subunit